jgi:hypothetical protein
VGCAAKVLDLTLSEGELVRVSVVGTWLERKDGIETLEGAVAHEGDLAARAGGGSAEDDDATRKVVFGEGPCEGNADANGSRS